MSQEHDLCRSCGAKIIWVKTEKGKDMPIDAEPVPDGNIVMSTGKAHVVKKDETFLTGTKFYKSHFATCPHAAQHRKPPA